MSSDVDEDCESRCMVQALQVSFGYPGRAVAQEASHCWHAGLCLLQGDELFDKGFVTEDDLEAYHDLNMRFHQVIIEGSHNPAIADALARNDHLPFASVTALAVDRKDMVREYRRFNFAHMQHHAVFDALVNRQGARAEQHEADQVRRRGVRVGGGRRGPRRDRDAVAAVRGAAAEPAQDHRRRAPRAARPGPRR